MSKKYCTKCGNAVNHTIFECPQCNGSMFDHRDPNLPTNPSQTNFANLTPIKPQMSPEETKAAMRLAYDKRLGEEKVLLFKERMRTELEEIQYQEWRNRQPEWEKILKKIESNNKLVAPLTSNPVNSMLSTAAGVMLGTTTLRHQLKDSESLSDDSSSSQDDGHEGGFFDFISGLFD